MTLSDALQLATRNAADALGRLDDLGTLEMGKIADLIVVEGNPLENIKMLQDIGSIKVVVKEGKVDVDRR